MISILLLLSSPSALWAQSVNAVSNATNAMNSAGADAARQVGSNLANQANNEYKKCSAENPQACDLGALLSGLSLLSMLQGGAHDGSAGQALDTAGNTSASTTGTTQNLATSTSTKGFDSLPVAKLSKGINGNSVDYKNGLVKTADGKTYKASDFSSPAAMAASGFSPDEINSALAAAKAAEKDALEKVKLGALTPSSGIDDGGGGGGGGYGAPASSDSSGVAPVAVAAKVKPPDEPVDTTPKNFNGDPIGSSGDSIFAMMARRYKFKDKQNAFIDERELPYLKN
jgi:hypothetical protein